MDYQELMQGMIGEFIMDRIILDMEDVWKWSEDNKVISRNYDNDNTIRFKVLTHNGLVVEYLVGHEDGKIKRWTSAYMQTDWEGATWIEVR